MRHTVGPAGSALAGRWVTVGLCLENTAAVRVEVEDDDPRLPQPCEDPDELATQGRGLWIIEQLADRLWWERSGYGGNRLLSLRPDPLRGA
ncbi:anti-sigma regulatory factor (Ser/Thr protein kinase) [Streptomyces sp. V4I23]|nr:anti-sigma regulatory factor (Ser/Thr protein kinase) [Streptomyces sp. V4I23]